MSHRVLWTLVLTSLLALQVQAVEQTERVLLLGDSHAYGKYGQVLDNHFRSDGAAVTSLSSCGSSPSTWMKSSSDFKVTNCGFWKKTPDGKETRVQSHRLSSFADELNKSRPTLTVITLGTNILASPQNIASEKTHIESMMKLIKEQGSNCVWVGPPDLSKNPFKKNLPNGVRELEALAKKNNCHFIDSTQLTTYPTGRGDGIHYSPQDSTRWGNSVVSTLKKIHFTRAPKPASSQSTKKETGTR